MKIFIFTLVVFLFSSCDMFSYEEEQKFYLPYASEWSISCSKDSNLNQTLVVGQKFSLDVYKNEATAILAYDTINKCFCGTIYPYGNSLTAQDAFAAEILLTLTLGSTNSLSSTKDYLSKFNWERFLSECREFGDDVQKLDKNRITEKISLGTFRKTDLKLLE